MPRFYKSPAPAENKVAHPVEEVKDDENTSADTSKTESATDKGKGKGKSKSTKSK